MDVSIHNQQQSSIDLFLIQTQGAQVFLIGEAHKDAGDTSDILCLLEKLKKERKLTFYIEHFLSEEPENKGSLNKVFEEKAQKKVLTQEFEAAKKQVKPRKMNVEELANEEYPNRLISELGHGYQIELSFKQGHLKSEYESFDIQNLDPVIKNAVIKNQKILNFALKNKIDVFGIDLPSRPEDPNKILANNRIIPDSYYEKRTWWDTGRDPWMAQQISNFVRANPGKTLICFIGSEHAKGIRKGERIPVDGFSGLDIIHPGKIVTLNQSESIKGKFNIYYFKNLKELEYEYSFSPDSTELVKQQSLSLFPNLQFGFNYAFSNEPVLLNGMKVIFDRPVPVSPVTLRSKGNKE